MSYKYHKILYCTVYHSMETGHLHDYFFENSEHFYEYIYAPIFKNRPAILRYYHNRLLISENQVMFYKGNNKLLIYFFTLVQYIFFVFKFSIRNTFTIVYEPILFIGSRIQSLFLNNHSVIWLWDYFPNDTVLIHLLNIMTNFYVKHAKFSLFLTDNIRNEYSHLYANQQIWKTIGLGMDNQNIKHATIVDQFGFIGNLKRGQGLELVFDFIKNDPVRKLDVVGNGAFKEDLIKIVKKLDIENQVNFLGYQSESELKTICSRWQIAFATYDLTVKNNVYYADPSKIKLYLELGVPVIMTKVTYFESYLQKFNAGICISYSLHELSEAVRIIQDKYMNYQYGVKKLVKVFDYKILYEKGFSFMEHE